MDLRQLLGMLQGVRGPNASGEYTAKCPAHEDKTASLTVTCKHGGKDGKERLFLNCFAGCSFTDVIGALGITAKDLIVNPDPDDDRKRGAAKTQRKAGSAARSQRGGSRTPTDADVPPEYADGPAVDPETGENLQGVKTENVGGVTVHTTANAGSGAGGAGHGASGGVGQAGKGAGNGGNGAGGDAGLEIDWKKPDKVYSYTDAEGKELFQVVRYHYLNGPGKTFRQRRYDPADPKANREGYVSSVPAEIRDSTLYRLPEVARAIQDGRAVYVVEGEKDADTLARLGFCGTCNPGGAGKWRDGYSRALTGADVIILPDCDSRGNGFTGQNHAWDVAVQLRGIAKRVRLVDIKEACPEIPEKGDISDMVQIMGDTEAMDALARQVAATMDFNPQAVPFWLTPMEQAERLYNAVDGYGVVNGCIVQYNGHDIKDLTDFVAIPRQELTRDDGMEKSLYFVLDGWGQRGQKLGRVTVKAGDLDSMNWVTERWGFDASLMPGSTVKGKVAWVIKKVGQMTAQKVTEYTHTGWRKIGGKYAFLYHGGAVGMEGVTVDMGEALKTYRLDGSGAEWFDRITPKEAALTSLRMKDIMSRDVGYALLGTVYLAPLREFLQMTDVVPAFALFLYGESGTHKSTAAGLAMAHCGNFHAKNAPASFNDTANQIRKKAFLVKDLPILVDDYHPATSLQEKRQMSATAQGLSRAFGDSADRGRLNADRTLAGSAPPRSVAIITGEDLPAIGASGLARFFILDIDKGDIPVTRELTEMQEAARRGVLQRAMRGYIEWLAKQTDRLPEELHDTFLKYRDMCRDTGGHDRAPEAMACILMGINMMLRYFVSIGAVSMEEAVRISVEARTALSDASKKQARDMQSEKPSRIFLDAVAELISSKQAGLVDLTLAPDQKQTFMNTEKIIGYMDGSFYYLLPNVVFAQVSRLCREQGQEFPVSLKALYKHLRTDGILPGVGKEENPTKVKWIDGKSVRLLWIPVDKMAGPKVDQEQMKMTEAADAELPEGW